MPRVLDVLNTYLRAVEVRDLEEPASLARLRAQMLRRIQVVTGEGRVRDLLDHRIRAELGNARMDLLMNGLLMAATLFAGGYCWVLARRVRDLKSLDKGLGGAIVTLTRQVELARTTLDEARAASSDTRQDLAQLVAKADGAAGQLRMLIAAAPVPPPAAAPRAAAAPAPGRPSPCAAGAEPAACRPPQPRRPLSAPAARPGAAPPRTSPRCRSRGALAPVENPLRRRKDAEPRAGAAARTTSSRR